MSVKAYIVQEPDEYTGDIYYAKSDIEAKRALMGEKDIDELAGIMCRRCPAMDEKQGDPRAQVRHLLSIGWHFHDGEITEDDRPFVSKQGHIYRNWMEWLVEREKKALRRRAQQEAERNLWGKWPWAEDIRAHIEPSGKVDASIWLPFMQDSLRYLEREDAHYVTRRDLIVFRQAYTVNLDGEWQL